MPFLSHALIGAMLARPRDYDLLVPRSPHPGSTRNALGIETLHAIYSKACLGPIRAMLEQGQRQIAALIGQVRVAYVEPEEARRYDPAGALVRQHQHGGAAGRGGHDDRRLTNDD